MNPQDILNNTLLWIQSLGSIGAIAFILIYIVSTIIFFPGTVLTLGAGFIFGVAFGSLYVFIGATLGATGAFLIGRYLARDWVKLKTEGDRRFQKIDESVKKAGFKIVLLTRLSPLFPFILLNYLYGITSVSLKDYLLGSIGMIPGTVMYVYIGSLAGNIATLGTESPPTNMGLQWIIRLLGFVATVVVTIYITKIARQALDNEMGT